MMTALITEQRKKEQTTGQKGPNRNDNLIGNTLPLPTTPLNKKYARQQTRMMKSEQ
jgi:hypothetical protein